MWCARSVGGLLQPLTILISLPLRSAARSGAAVTDRPISAPVVIAS